MYFKYVYYKNQNKPKLCPDIDDKHGHGQTRSELF